MHLYAMKCVMTFFVQGVYLLEFGIPVGPVDC